MTELKTDQGLLTALSKAAHRQMSEAEMLKQRISFILGMVKESSAVTRDRVEEVLSEHQGRKLEAK